MYYIISPVVSASATGSSLSWLCQENLQREACRHLLSLRQTTCPSHKIFCHQSWTTTQDMLMPLLGAWAYTRPSACWSSRAEEASRTTISAKSRDEIQRFPNWTVSSQWLHLKILAKNIMGPGMEDNTGGVITNCSPPKLSFAKMVTTIPLRHSTRYYHQTPQKNRVNQDSPSHLAQAGIRPHFSPPAQKPFHHIKVAILLGGSR